MLEKEIINELQLVNINFILEGFHFDAAVDINYQLHCYDLDEEFMKNHIAIEIYNYDCPDWDVFVIFQESQRSIHRTSFTQKQYVQRCVVDFNDIIEQTKKWIKNEKQS
jgi:hypothetical protein